MPLRVSVMMLCGGKSRNSQIHGTNVVVFLKTARRRDSERERERESLLGIRSINLHTYGLLIFQVIFARNWFYITRSRQLQRYNVATRQGVWASFSAKFTDGLFVS